SILRPEPQSPANLAPMTFRNSAPRPLAYLTFGSGEPMECRLVRYEQDLLTVHIPDAKSRLGKLPLGGTLALDPTPRADQPPVEAFLMQGTGEKDEYQIRMDQPRAFWRQAIAGQDHNRRQAFRVRNLDFGPDRPQEGMELTARLERGALRIPAEIMNLSLGGCNLRIPKDRLADLPAEGTHVLVILEGQALEEPLRLPSAIKRHFHHSRRPRVGLRFLTRENATWLRMEYQLQDYLMERQRQQLRFRPSA
ncbi:MAG: PilZ domain-containing protein, partial [Planctomycetes bacterium]|nr:PilZ domain-containing protein [Planctomycetota bacterium]